MGRPKKSLQEIKTGSIHKAVETATSKYGQQNAAGPEEVKARMESLTTQGRKGCKALRINMAFSPSNYEFLHVMSKASGKTLTKMCNMIVSAYRNEHPELLEHAQAFLDFVNSGKFFNDLNTNEEAYEEEKEP